MSRVDAHSGARQSPSLRAGWFDTLRGLDVGEVAEAFGLTAGGRGGSRWLSPCPLCKQPSRHRKTNDSRGAVGLTPDGLGWRCFQCDAAGDGVTLAALVVTGETLGRGDPRWREVRAECARLGLTGRNSNRSEKGTGRAESRKHNTGEAAKPNQPRFPPAGEVAALWALCGSVLEDAEALRWVRGDVEAGLKARAGIRLERVELYDLARVVPEGADVPSWATRWVRCGYRLAIPLYDSAGRMASVKLRHLTDPEAKDRGPWVKGEPPYRLAGTVFADPLTRSMLAGDDDAAELVARNGLVITEGSPNYLAWASSWRDADDDAQAVLGIGSGAWTAEHAARIPDGTRITIDTDPDKAGDDYRKKIEDTLAARRRTGDLTVEHSKRTASYKAAVVTQ